MKKLYFLLFAIMITSLSFGQELLTDGGLEAWDDSTTLTNWGNYEDLSQETTDVNGGANAAKRDGGVDDDTAKLFQTVAVTGGDNYTVSLWYKVVSGGDDADVRIWSLWKSGGATMDNAEQSDELKGPNNGFLPSNTGTWTEYTATVNAPAGADELKFEVRAYGTTVVIWDDFSVFHNATAMPALSISSPTSGDIPSGDFNISYNIQNFALAANNSDTTQDGHMHYYFDGDDTNPIMIFDPSMADIAITGMSEGAHTLYMELVDNSHDAISPAVNYTVSFNVSSYTQVVDIAALRAGTIGGNYELTGEAFINNAQDYRNQKFIQDASAGILIDDNNSTITGGVRGDGLTGIKGVLSEYKGMLQFQANQDAAVTSPSTLTLPLQVVTLAELTSNYEDYEAELVKVVDVMLADYDDAGAGTADGTFQNGKVYPMAQSGAAFSLRTSFYDVDYITTSFPTVAVDIVALPSEKTGSGSNDFGMVISPRDSADITTHVAAVSENNINGFAMYPNPVNGDVLNITTAQNLTKNVQIFDILGKQVFAKTITGTTLNVTNLNAGIYLIKVEEAGNSVTKKLVIK